MNPIRCRAIKRLVLGVSFALVPLAHVAAEPAKCSYTPIGKLPLRYSGPSLQVTTQGSINGTPAELLVDTGAFQTALTRTGAERRGLKLRDTGSRASGVGGISAIFATNIDEMIVGPVRAGRTNIPVLVSFGDTPGYDAILGAPFLLQTDLELSLPNKQLIFFVPENCSNANLGYWGANVQSVGMRRHGEDQLNPYFFVRVNGKEMEAMIDSGAAVSTISARAAKRAGIEFDKPGVDRGTGFVGVGDYVASSWYVTVPEFQIGDETIKNAELAVEDSGTDSPEVTLGDDFLRSHRVLFAMSQNKVYFSYVGGDPFNQGRKLEPWVAAEAEGGNPDAQYVLARVYANGERAQQDSALAASWLEKAAAGGSARANLSSGYDLLVHRDYAKAATRLRIALDKLPAERDGAIALYIARVRTGQEELGKSELAATFARANGDEWPKPIADFYLGKLPADKLLAQAADDREKGKRRRCEALSAMGDWHRAHAQADQAKALDAQLKDTCGDLAKEFPPIGD
jgi:predicted aspartyl protease